MAGETACGKTGGVWEMSVAGRGFFPYRPETHLSGPGKRFFRRDPLLTGEPKKAQKGGQVKPNGLACPPLRFTGQYGLFRLGAGFFYAFFPVMA